MNTKRVLRVCYFGTYRINYPRNRLNTLRLRKQGFEVFECHERLWEGDIDRQRIITGGWRKPEFWLRVIKAYVKLIFKYLKIKEFDIMIIGYPGHFDIFLGKFLSWFKGKPIVFDVLMSLYLISRERNIQSKHKKTVEILRKIEKIAVHLPDTLLIDTPQYKRWFIDNYGIDPNQVKLLPLGADDTVFYPKEKYHKSNSNFKVLYYGSFIPNHGVLTIIKAAKLLKGNTNIQFELIGEGPEKHLAFEYVENNKISNLLFTKWLDKKDLIQRISEADVILGSFGQTPQSMMTIHNKIWESLAMAKPVINGLSPVIQEHFIHGKHIYLCKRNDPESLVDSIIYLRDNPELCRKISKEGNRLFLSKYSLDKIGEKLSEYMYELSKCREIS